MSDNIGEKDKNFRPDQRANPYQQNKYNNQGQQMRHNNFGQNQRNYNNNNNNNFKYNNRGNYNNQYNNNGAQNSGESQSKRKLPYDPNRGSNFENKRRELDPDVFNPKEYYHPSMVQNPWSNL